MGGYGAMKLGLSCPDKFAAVGSLSGALDILDRLANAEPHFYNEFAFIFEASEEERQKEDLFYLAEKLNNSSGPKPRIYIWCGTEDFLYQDNVKFKNYLEKLKFDFIYEESAGDHSWQHWDIKIQAVLKFIFNQGR
jgi:S-formylglutathione hydrolase FrmB